MIDCFKNQNNTIQTKKPKVKTIYEDTKTILGTKDNTIFGDTMWKSKIKKINFAKIWTNSHFFLFLTTSLWPTIQFTALQYKNK